ncbi:MAG: ADP-glyceromanno-heptose 6-epimerase [Steroidobacteraceae bacterium]|jgi:ADP-L-glycero-D-manno-heptose 6-epimerase
MHVVTGGAGFIGSNIVAALAARGDEVVVCDWLRSDERWRNLAKHEIAALIAPEDLPAWLRRNGARVESVVHMGAVTSTTETDVDRIVSSNIRASLELLDWCTEAKVRLIYASSAATYGDGSAGFDDSFSCEALAALRPLNAYAWSKHVVDRRIARCARHAKPLPPQWVGLKFFNVYGPNEYHKGSMQSLVAKNYAVVRDGRALQLFRSYRPEYADGGQLRDFVYVKDCVDVVLWLLDHERVSGLFNLGTGQARSWLDLAKALFDAADRPVAIEFIDMPGALIEKYQYFTQARMDRLRAAGYVRPFTPLEHGVSQYIRRYLAAPDRYH